MLGVTLWAGYVQIQEIYIPNGQFPLAGLAAVSMFLMSIVFVGTFVRWAKLMKIKSLEKDLNGEEVKGLVDR
ncbi:hypothetical protein [Sphingobacterium mizutaii]|uniref:hypothetical protein n=1 Tax=Sphingobacterium mizutaii TaxID=1010 RepID=UPI00289CE4D3|nr:hypothetical protein [Sphingobacterium mizutaii]